MDPARDPSVGLQRQGREEEVLKERAWEVSLPHPGQDESPLP